MKKHVLYLLLLAVTFSFTSCSALNQLAKSQKIKKEQEAKAKKNGGDNLNSRDVYNPNGVRYRDKVFNEFDVIKNLTFLKGDPTWDNKTVNLSIDIYTPKNDPNPKGRPCFVFYYGGAWASKMKNGIAVLNSEMAMRGYVAVSGDYRVGFPQSNGALLCLGNPKKNMPEAAFRAFQDTRALIRYLRANADKLGIDPNKIYVAGGSAGGANAVNVAYLNDNDIPVEIKSKIGGLDAVGDYKNVSSKPNGVISLSGPLIAPPTVMEKQNIPVYLLQGQCDELIPWDYANAFPYCSPDKYPMVSGCHAMYERLKQVGEKVWFDMVCGGGHDAFGWGFVELNKRMANFMYLVMTNQFRTGEYVFIPQVSSCPGKTFPECEKYIKK